LRNILQISCNTSSKNCGIVTALEFQLASDILKTAIAPTYENLIQLGAIAVIRTFLNYFLSKELKELPEMIKQNLEKDKI